MMTGRRLPPRPGANPCLSSLGGSPVKNTCCQPRSKNGAALCTLTVMASHSYLGHDELSMRSVLTIVAAPEDPSTCHLADSDGALPGLDQIAAPVWREGLHTVSSADILAIHMAIFERQDLWIVISDEKDWPVALDHLGERAPYALLTSGETALLIEPLAHRIRLTGARVSTAGIVTSSVAHRSITYCRTAGRGRPCVGAGRVPWSGRHGDRHLGSGELHADSARRLARGAACCA